MKNYVDRGRSYWYKKKVFNIFFQKFDTLGGNYYGDIINEHFIN